MKKTKILITGGTGFIGYHFAKSCIKKNWTVESLSTKNRKQHSKKQSAKDPERLIFGAIYWLPKPSKNV